MTLASEDVGLCVLICFFVFPRVQWPAWSRVQITNSTLVFSMCVVVCGSVS